MHKQYVHGRTEIAKPCVPQRNMKRRLQWCQEHKTWTAEQWKHVLFSDESTFTLFPTTGRVYVWRTPAEAYNPDCLLPGVKHGGGSIMVWAMISWFAAGPIITLHGRINSGDYVTILADHVHSMGRPCFRLGIAPFKMITPRFTEVELFNNGLRNIRMKLHTFPGLHTHRT
ncbi:hypothetical protein JGG67_22925 [Salmonella enterica subsp. enterica serovar Derby]|nr:hypothetical protein [Salmonella enterica subsp. enterica serovar Derby]